VESTAVLFSGTAIIGEIPDSGILPARFRFSQARLPADESPALQLIHQTAIKCWDFMHARATIGCMGIHHKMVLPFAQRSLARLALGLLFLLSFVISAVSISGDKTLAFVHKERALQPGEAILLEAHSARPLKQLAAKAFGRKFPTFAENGNLQWTGLVGIDLETKPGRYTVTLNGIDTGGNSVAARDVLTVIAKKFPTRELTVDEKYVTPPADLLARIQRERERVNGIFASLSPKRFWNGPFRVPVPGKVISAFGKRSVYNGQPRSPHAGTDFRGATGTPIRAPNAGKVVLAANLYYSGNTIILDHGLGLYSYFGHMSAFSVKEGDLVQSGQVIGKVGATGLVTGPHLHWTVRLVGSRIDPLSLVNILGDAGADTSVKPN
jgi:murein DD-endopeptidase MepM/ murein hydrolase activator NlpD